MTSPEPLSSYPPERRWRAQTAPVPVVVGLVRRAHNGRDEFLLIERNEGPYSGQWALVGGKWDFGEALDVAIEREVREETGLDTRFVALRGVLNERVVPMEPEGQAAHFLLLVCALRVVAGEAAEQQEGAVGWFTRAEIEKLHEGQAIIPSDYVMIAEFSQASVAAPAAEVELWTAEDGLAQLRNFTWLPDDQA